MSSPPDDAGRGLDEAVLNALFAGASVGLHVLDTQLRVVRISAAAQRNPAFPAESVLGLRLWELVPGLNAGQVERLLRGVLDTGEPAVDVELTGWSVVPPHLEIAVSASAFQLRNARGEVLGVGVFVQDVSERRRARRHLKLLERAGARLGATLDVFRTAQELAELVTPDAADAVTVDVVDSVLRGEATAAGPVIEDLPLRRAACQAIPGSEGVVVQRVGEMSGFPFGTPYAQCLADLQPRVVNDLRAAGDTLALDPAQRAGLRASGAHSLLVAPLIARGVVLGLAAFYRTSTPAPFDDKDVALAVDLASRTAVCLDNARLYNRERSAARLLQLSLRPPRIDSHLAVETARSYQPIGSGGDWFDVIQLSGERVALVAGDTGGQGLHAVASMAELRASTSALAMLDLPPDEVLERLHTLVARLALERSASSRDFSHGIARDSGLGARRPEHTTCLYAVYDPVSCRCAIASAGHPPPALAYPDGGVAVAPVVAGPPLGIGVARHESVVLELPPGAVLALCNAGLLRGEDGADVEPRWERLLRALGNDSRSLQERCDAVFRALSPRRPQGDAVLLLARARALGPDRAATWTWPHDPAVVAKVRDAVGRQLAVWGLDELRDNAVLVASELATNAICYSEGQFEQRLICGEHTVTCEISDTSSATPQLRHAEDDDEFGRGLFITSRLTSRWGVRRTSRGKVIWAEMARSQPDLAGTGEHA